MAKREVVTLNESTPQLVAPQSGDTYQLVRDVFLTTGVVKSEIADGASAVGVVLDTENAFSTSGAKIASFRTGGVEKAYVDKDGVLSATRFIGGAVLGGTSNHARVGFCAKTNGTQPEIDAENGYVGFRPGSVIGWRDADGSSPNNQDTSFVRVSAAVIKATDGSTGTAVMQFLFPTSDPGIAGVWWDNAGTLTRSAG